MLDQLPPVEVLTPSALLGLAILAIITGRLVPRRTYDDKAHEADQWRTECRIKDQTIADLVDQNNILLRDVAPAMTAFMASLQHAGEEHR